MGHRVGALDRRHLDEGRGNHRIGKPPQRLVIERRHGRGSRHDQLARKHLAPIDDVRADGAAGQGASAHFLEIVGLADVDNERGDLGVAGRRSAT